MRVIRSKVGPRWWPVVLSLVWAAPLLAAEPGPIARALQPFVDSHRLAGAVVLVADKDRILACEAVGWADIAAAQPMRPDHLFWIASQTKAVTGTALMLLVDAGKLSLDDPVAKFVPEFAQLKVAPRDPQDTTPPVPPAHAVTIREVLCHVSGMRFLNSRDQQIIDAVPLAESIQHDLLEPLLFQPGTAYQYSNEGIDTAGLIIQLVSGLPYEQFVQDRLLTPLGMTDTSFFLDQARLARLAKSYRPTADQTNLEETRIRYLKYPLDRPDRYPSPGGGLFSTAADVGRFCQMCLNRGVWQGRRYLSEAAVATMTSKQTPDGVATGYGLGWSVGPTSFGHGGAYSTNMNVDTRRGLITVLMVQHAGFPGDPKEMYGALGTAVEQVVAEATARP